MYIDVRRNQMKTKFLIWIFLISLFTSLCNAQTFAKQDNPQKLSLSNIPRNSVLNEDLLIFSYQRIMPQTDSFGFTFKAGIMIFDPFLWVADFGIITGHSKHYFEAAIGGIAEPAFGDFAMFTIRANYRYQAEKGFVFKVGPFAGPPDNFIIPLVSIGYAF